MTGKTPVDPCPDCGSTDPDERYCAGEPPVSDDARGVQGFVGEILARTPNGERIAVQYHPNGDWFVAAQPIGQVSDDVVVERVWQSLSQQIIAVDQPPAKVITREQLAAALSATNSEAVSDDAAVERVRAAIRTALADTLNGKPSGCIVVKGCEAADYIDPEAAAHEFIAAAADAAIAAMPTPPKLDEAVVAGPVTLDDDNTNEDGGPVWAAEVQSVGGYGVVATVYGSSEAYARERQQAVIAALSATLAELRGLISEASIERLAEDIAIACVDCRPEIKEARHRAMVRLGERLRKPLKRDLEAAAKLGSRAP